MLDRNSRRRYEEYRKSEAGDIENSLIDEYLTGEFDRRELFRRASVFGLSVPVIGLLLRAAGEPAPAFAASARVAASTSRLRLGINPAPASGIEPSTYADLGAAQTQSICGEYLNRGAQSKQLLPELALSWKPNTSGDVWTYKLRPGVQFQTGQPMTADDVVATWKRLTSANSAALSAIGSYLEPSGVVKVDDMTVAFHLMQPVGNFAYLTSSFTPSAIILPADYQIGTFVSKPQTTGAFELAGYTSGVSATFNRTSGWWGGTAPLAGVDVTYFTASPAADAALLGGTLDMLPYVTKATDISVINDSSLQLFVARGALHSEVPMRVDDNNPLADYRVRQAIALTLDRPATISTLFSGRADLGNDSPFAPAFDLARGVPQRKQDIRMAKELMEAAGHAKGFKIPLTAQEFGEIPDLAQIIQQSVKAINVDMSIQLVTEAADYAGSQSGPPKGWGNTPWLNAPMTITPWGGRPVPNVYLVAALSTLSKSGAGIWNAAHYSNRQFDSAVKSFLAATTHAGENKYATEMQRILLHDTPVLFPYFYDWIAVASPTVKGYKADTQGGVYLSKTSIS